MCCIWQQTIQQLQLEIQRQRAGLPLRMSPAPCNGTLSPTGGNGTVASATSLPQSLAPSSLTGSSSGKVAPGIDAGDGSGAGNEREQLQQLAALQEEVLALKAALVGQPVAANRTSSTSSSTTSSARASMDSARMRDQGPIPVAVAAEVAGPAAAAAYANTALENLKTAALCASVPSASTPAAAGTAEQVPFVAPPLLKTTSAGEKVAGLLQELKMAMAEAEVEQVGVWHLLWSRSIMFRGCAVFSLDIVGGITAVHACRAMVEVITAVSDSQHLLCS